MPTPRPQSTTGVGVDSPAAKALLQTLMKGLFDRDPDLRTRTDDALDAAADEAEAAEAANSVASASSDNTTTATDTPAAPRTRISLAEALSGNSDATVGRITVEHLRALDIGHRETVHLLNKPTGGMRGVPKWLYAAHLQAQLELAEWHTARGVPLPTDETDPGDAGADEAQIDFPRPAPATPFQRTVEYLKCRASVVYFIDNYCYLTHKVDGVIPFRLWRWQAWLLYAWRAHAKVVNLKARQIGVSELAAGYALWTARFHDTKKILLLSIDQDKAQELLSRAKVMLTYLPPWLNPGELKHPNPNGPDSCVYAGENMTHLALAHLDRQDRGHVSSIDSLPATENQGRSLTAALVIMDELAEMKWGRQIWQAAEPTAEHGGQVLAISTAKGRANIMYDLYRGGLDNINGFFPAFLSWRRHPLRDEAWYANKKRIAEYENKLPKLHQEYPSNDLEAFVQSARQEFDNAVLARHEERIKAEMRERAETGMPAWEEVDGLTIYEEPNPDHTYIIGADVAEGLEKGDYSDASVVCRETGHEMAALRGHWPMDVYAEKLDEIGYRYNEATLAVERNNHGHAVLLALVSGLAHERWAHTRIAYPKLYHYKEAYIPGRRQDSRPGWHTNVATKPQMVSSLARGLRDDVYFPRSQVFTREATDFERDEAGRMGAPEGRCDDTVMSRAIAVHLMLLPDAKARSLQFIRDYRARVDAQVTGQKPETVEAVAAVAEGAPDAITDDAIEVEASVA